MEKYLYGTLYAYLPATQLASWHAYMARMHRYSHYVPNSLLQAAAFNARALFPDIVDPTMTEEEFSAMREREKMVESLNEADKEELFNKESEELRDELDALSDKEKWEMFESKPPAIPTEKVTAFINDSNNALKPLLKALAPGESFLEDVVIAYHKNPSSNFYPLFTAWRELRILHEGCPPYKIQFSQTFIEQMSNIDPSFDPIMATIATGTTKLTQRSEKIITAGLNSSKHKLPEIVTPAIYAALISKIQ